MTPATVVGDDSHATRRVPMGRGLDRSLDATLHAYWVGAGGHVAQKAHAGRRAEGAADGAADLTRDAEGDARSLGGARHVHRFDARAVGQLEHHTR